MANSGFPRVIEAVCVGIGFATVFKFGTFTPSLYSDWRRTHEKIENLEHSLFIARNRCIDKPKGVEMRFSTPNGTHVVKCLDVVDQSTCKIETEANFSQKL